MRYRVALIISVLLIGIAVGNGVYTHLSEEAPEHPNDTVTQGNPETRSDSSDHDGSSHHHGEGTHQHGETDEKDGGGTGYEDRYLNKYSTNSSPEWVSGENFTMDDTARTYEVTRYPDTEPTEEHLDAAWELYNSSYNAAKEEGLFDVRTAREKGYRVHDFIHYVNKEYYLDDEELNPHKPESLVYYRNFSSNESGVNSTVLAGYMYMASSLNSSGQQVGGPLTVWHFHPQNKPYCFASRLNKGFEFEGIECQNDVKKKRSTEMIHVWFVKAPEGPFSTDVGSFEYIEEVYNKTETDESGLMPEKMSEEEFKSYAMDSYNEYFR